MTAEQESALIDRYYAGCKDAENALVASVSKQCHWLSQRLARRACDQQDLYSCGLEAAWKALRSYRSDKGAKFSTYAVRAMAWRMSEARNEINRHQSRFSPTSFVDGRCKHDPVLTAENSELRELVKQAISTLPERQQSVARGMMGYTAKENAAAMGVSPGLVMQLRPLVKIKLAKVMPWYAGY